MDRKLAQLQTIAPKDKAQGYISLLSEALSQGSGAVRDVHAVLTNALTQDNVGQVVQRQVLTTLTEQLRSEVVKDGEVKRQIIEDAIAIAQPSGSTSAALQFEEQARSFVFVLISFVFFARFSKREGCLTNNIVKVGK